jgi:hypothetical protein
MMDFPVFGKPHPFYHDARPSKSRHARGQGKGLFEKLKTSTNAGGRKNDVNPLHSLAVFIFLLLTFMLLKVSRLNQNGNESFNENQIPTYKFAGIAGTAECR